MTGSQDQLRHGRWETSLFLLPKEFLRIRKLKMSSVLSSFRYWYWGKDKPINAREALC